MTSTDRATDFADRFGVALAHTAQAGLSPRLRQLHQAILTLFIDGNPTPTTSEITEHARRLGLEPDHALAELTQADLVHARDGAVVVAYPFSGRPTRHQVHLHHPHRADTTVWSMCAADALGIPAMTGLDAAITSTDPHTNQPIRIVYRAGAWTWEPASTIVLAAGDCRAAPGATAADACCGNVDFFATPANAQAHLAAHPGLAGDIYDQATAIETGRVVFATLLNG